MKLLDLKNYKKWNNAMRAAFWFVFVSMAQKALSFITVPVFTRIMNTEQYGIYSTYLSWSSIIAVFLTLNLDSGAYSNVLGKSQTEEEKNIMTVSYASLCFVLTTVAFIGVLIFIAPFSKFTGLSPDLLILMFICIYATPIVNYWTFKQRFDYKYKILVSFVLVKAVINVVAGICLVTSIYTKSQARGRVLSIVLPELISAIFIYIYFARKSKNFFSTKGWKDTLKFQLPLIPHFLSMNFLLSSDRIMIQKMVGASEAGIYSVAYSAGQIMIILKSSIVDAMRPWIYEKLNSKRYKDLSYTTNVIVFGVTLLSIVFSTIAPELIKILAAPQYYNAIYVVPPVAISALFTFIYQIFVVIETYYEKTTNIMAASMTAAGINLILNFIMIPVFGYVVAGYTTLISYLFLSIFHYIAVRKIELEEKTIQMFNLKTIVAIAIFGIVACILVSFLYQYVMIRYFLVFSFIVVAAIFRDKLIKLIKQIKK